MGWLFLFRENIQRLAIVTRDNSLATIGRDAQVTIRLAFTTTDTEYISIGLNEIDKVLVAITSDILDIHVAR